MKNSKKKSKYGLNLSLSLVGVRKEAEITLRCMHMDLG